MLGVEVDIQFEVAGLRLDAKFFWPGTEAGCVGAVAVAVGVLQEVNLLLRAWGEVDVVFGCDWVFFCCASGCRILSVGE